MALLPILHYPDPRLHTVAKPVTEFDVELEKLILDMAETMYTAPGIGLAATQVDVHKQVIVIDVSETRDQLMVFINPTIIAEEGSNVYQEGCLSVPGIYEEVERPATVTVRATNMKSETFEIVCEGLLATCVQHEMDHLKGRVFVQYLSKLKQNRIRTKIKKRQMDEDEENA